jgi:hypothetical protein
MNFFESVSLVKLRLWREPKWISNREIVEIVEVEILATSLNLQILYKSNSRKCWCFVIVANFGKAIL